jgi:tRNA (cmo5U34)-methyltransferase
MNKKKPEMKDWRNTDIARNFLTGIRGAIPLAETQLEVISRIVKEFIPDLKMFMDLGCGDGVLGRYIHEQHPGACGIYLDYSAHMISELGKKVQYRSKIINEDYSQEHWLTVIEHDQPFDLILSGYSIHHLQNEDKKKLYRRIYDLLRKGGLFLNLEHVASESQRIEAIHDNIFIDAIAEFNKDSKSRETVKSEYENREDRILNILVPVEKQCRWLREAGFIHVDCYFKLFELALFGGVK